MHPADLISFWAQANPERPAIIQTDMAITYRGLAEAIDSIAGRMERYDLDKRQPVAVAIDHPVRQLAVCFALLRCGVTTALVGRGALPHLRANDINNVIYAVEGQILSGGRNIRFDDSWMRRDGGGTLLWNPSRPSLAVQADMIFFTSGTTGAPKKIVLPGAALMEWVKMLPIYGNADHERMLIVPGLDSSFGFNHTAVLLYAGKTACFARGADAQLTLINTFGIEALVASPQQALALVEHLEKGARCQVDSLEEVRIGGGFSSSDLVRRIKARLCRNVMTAYGATEAGIMAFANYDMIADVPNAVGILAPGIHVETVDEANAPLPLGSEGQVRIRSSYFSKVLAANNPDKAAEAADVWWYPGDFGRLTEQGILCIGGRADDVINCGGVKVSGVVLDEAVRQYPGIKDAGVCAVRSHSGIEEVWIAIVAETSIDFSDLERSLEQSSEFKARVGRIFMIEQVPRNELGKLQRHLLKEKLIAMTERSPALA